jgi:hypothetical protein
MRQSKNPANIAAPKHSFQPKYRCQAPTPPKPIQATTSPCRMSFVQSRKIEAVEKISSFADAQRKQTP